MTVVRTYRCASIDIGVINLAFCVVDFVERRDGTFVFDLVRVERATIGRMSDTIQALSEKLLLFYNTVDALRNHDQLDYVFIEQQLSRAVKNTVLAYVTLSYFETKSLPGVGAAAAATDNHPKVVFVSPKKKFAAVKFVFHPSLMERVDFERRGRALKKLSVDVATLLFTTFRAEVGMRALKEYKTKLDDVSDVFLQSFAFFLEKFASTSKSKLKLKSAVHVRGDTPVSFIGGEEHGQCEDADEEA